ncbi:MAG: septum site-determining protein MinC [Chloroflexota bacterium]|nr:MAG: septum site-determining protein MinC [Chloroflexota bacterium]
MDDRAKVQIKGIREGLLISVRDDDWPSAKATLQEQIKEQADFLRGGKLILDVGNQVIRAAELGQLRDMLTDDGLSLWAVLSNSPVTEQNAQLLGLATRISKPTPERKVQTIETALTGEEAVLVRRTLRSGFSLQYFGHVIVIGDVNPGSEIIAGGDVIVWGHLRGMVHAGAEGNQDAVVCAMDLSPTQLRIADHIATTPKNIGNSQPEMARIIDGQVVALPWQP